MEALTATSQFCLALLHESPFCLEDPRLPVSPYSRKRVSAFHDRVPFSVRRLQSRYGKERQREREFFPSLYPLRHLYFMLPALCVPFPVHCLLLRHSVRSAKLNTSFHALPWDHL